MKNTLRSSLHHHQPAMSMLQGRRRRGKRENWRVTQLSEGCRIRPLCLSLALIFIAMPSRAQTPPLSNATLSKYYPVYSGNVTAPGYLKAPFWRMVTAMGNVALTNGIAIWNTTGTYGPGVVSESMGYAMILAALYDDKATFDRLSATVQAGIKSGVTGLFPWYWTQKSDGSTEYLYKDVNSASDADIDIALAYVYADMAVKVYGWGNPSTTYQAMAHNYIAAIREHDFSKSDRNAGNNYVLADGYKQAASTFSTNNWHPDYSDIRAYQLFQIYDVTNTPFWNRAITITINCWKAIFNFGSNDKRTNENADTGPVHSAVSWVKLSNPTYQNLGASSDFAKVTATREGSDAQYYTSDSQRLPIRLVNYINAKRNSTDVDIFGIANANLTALGTSSPIRAICISLIKRILNRRGPSMRVAGSRTSPRQDF